MKTDRSGPPDVSARVGPSADEAADLTRPLLRRVLTTAAVVAVAMLLLFLTRHAIIGLLLTRGVGALIGHQISIGAFQLGQTRTVLTQLHVETAGDPFFDAQTVTLNYSLRDLFSGGTHRLGITALRLDRPVLTVVRHEDGSYNFGRGSGGGGSAAAPGGGAPWRLDLRVHDGEIRLLDRAPVAGDLGRQQITGIELDLRLRGNERSIGRGSAAVVARQTGAAALRGWPITLGATIDYPRGVAIVRINAPQFPVRGVLGFLQHSPVVRVDDGLLRDVDVKVFALDIAPDRPVDLHVGGTAELSGGRLKISALARPVRDLRGRITLVDDGVWATRLDASVAGIPVVARGGAFDRRRPTLRLGVAANGDLGDLRTAFAFSQRQPVAGGVHVETLLEAPISSILIRSALHVAHGTYAKVPLAEVVGRVDYHDRAVVLDGVRARYGAATLGLGARFLLGGPALDSEIAVAASAPGRSIPFAENLVPEATVDVAALISGGRAGYRAQGALGLRGSPTVGEGTFAVDERGSGEFGPFALTRSDGSSLIGALRMERPTSQSAAWISARRYRVDVPAIASRFAGLSVPAFPPVAGVIDGELAGGGTPDAFALTGQLRGHDLRVGAARLGTGHTSLGGTLGDVRLAGVALDGPLGRFTGTGAAARGGFALHGAYDGSLERLVPLTGNQQGHGAVRGDVLATFAGSDVVVQSSNAALRGGSVRGVALDTAAGTIAVRRNQFHLIAGSGSIQGARAVAAESHGTVAVSAPDIPSAALHGTGLPLEAGNVSAYGVADLRGKAPDFDGTVMVAGGRAHGYGLAGDAQIDVDGPRARIVTATGALGSTYGTIGGSIAGIGQRALTYDLNTRVPLGDIDLLRRDLSIPVRHLAGTFAANLHVHGSGTRPFVDGRMEAPEGMYNGLAFRDAAARVVIDAYGVAARDGTVTVGSTKTAIAASTGGGGAFGIAASSPAADLADFNDYFDASETLAGRGRFDTSFRTYGGRIVTQGGLDITGLRYRNFPLGDVAAKWNTRDSTIAGTAGIRSAAGALAATASVRPGTGPGLLGALRSARYDAHASFSHLDLGTWVPAAGSSAPVLGMVNARMSVAGRLPQLGVSADVTLDDATIAGFAISDAHLRATALGSRINVLESRADVGFAQLAGSGKLGLGDRDPLAFDLRVTTNNVGSAVRRFVPGARGLDVAGALEADVRVDGTRALPKIAGGFDLTDARYAGFVVPRTIGALALTGRAIELRDADVEFTRGQAFVAGSLPLTLAPFSLGPPRAPLSFDVTAHGVDLAQFAPLLPAGTKLGGTIDGRFGVEGTVSRPRLLGSLAITEGSYTSPFERAPIQHVGGNLIFSGSSVALQAFHAGVGGGTLDASGQITLPLGEESSVRYRADVIAKAAKLDFPAYGRGTIDGDLHFTGRAAQSIVSGTVALRDAAIPVSAVYGTAAGPAPAGRGSGFALNPAFRIHAEAGNNVRVRSSIVDIGVTGAVDVAGTLRAPQLAGGFTATDGTISSYNHVFRIVNASVSFNPADGIIPTVDARAVSRVTNPDPDPSRNIAGSANVIVTVSGTADSNNLQVTYSSEPAYSQEQIVGLLLDVPALLGAVNFDLNGGSGSPLLRGAPGETNALLPPGVTPEQVSAISFNQEVFSLLNGQFTQRALTPVERVVEKLLGLSDIEFTVDYGGGIGYSLRRQLGKRDFYAFLSQTVSYPERANIGFELVPKPFETMNFSYYQQNGVTSLITNQTPGEGFLSSTRRLTSVQPLGNRSGFSFNFSRRF